MRNRSRPKRSCSVISSCVYSCCGLCRTWRAEPCSITVPARITAAQAKGVNVSAAQSALTDLKAKVADAHAKVNGLAEAVISGHTSPATAKTAITAAASDLKAAAADARTIRTTLRG